ncbi:hypothetical protein C8J56DRAFT_897378 [Mycena floridula]|nr:hypothetical protein C8J56DRAFT_897378 [Mycena floridula]
MTEMWSSRPSAASKAPLTLTIEEFLECFSNQFLPDSWQMDLIRAQNDSRQGLDSFESYSSRVGSYNTMLQGTTGHFDDEWLIELLLLGMHPALHEEVEERKIVEDDLDKWLALVHQADSSLWHCLNMFEESLSKCLAINYGSGPSHSYNGASSSSSSVSRTTTCNSFSNSIQIQNMNNTCSTVSNNFQLPSNNNQSRNQNHAATSRVPFLTPDK